MGRLTSVKRPTGSRLNPMKDDVLCTETESFHRRRAVRASLPPGTTLRWNPGCVRLGGEPLLSSESELDEFQTFCLEHRIDFVLVPSG